MMNLAQFFLLVVMLTAAVDSWLTPFSKHTDISKSIIDCASHSDTLHSYTVMSSS